MVETFSVAGTSSVVGLERSVKVSVLFTVRVVFVSGVIDVGGRVVTSDGGFAEVVTVSEEVVTGSDGEVVVCSAIENRGSTHSAA